MAISAVTVATSTTPVAVWTSVEIDGTDIVVSNPSGAAVVLGGPDLTSGNAATHGFSLPAGQTIQRLHIGYEDTLYAVLATGTGTVSALQITD